MKWNIIACSPSRRRKKLFHLCFMKPFCERRHLRHIFFLTVQKTFPFQTPTQCEMPMKLRSLRLPVASARWKDPVDRKRQLRETLRNLSAVPARPLQEWRIARRYKGENAPNGGLSWLIPFSHDSLPRVGRCRNKTILSGNSQHFPAPVELLAFQIHACSLHQLHFVRN